MKIIEALEDIRLLYESGRLLSCLILIYSYIDALGWLSYGNKWGRDRNKRYKEFLNQFLKPEKTLKATADDLYSARCGILHTASAESDKTKRNNNGAKKIYYVAGRGGASGPIEGFCRTEADRVISIEALILSLEAGVHKFINELKNSNDSMLVLEIEERAASWLVSIPVKEG